MPRKSKEIENEFIQKVQQLEELTQSAEVIKKDAQEKQDAIKQAQEEEKVLIESVTTEVNQVMEKYPDLKCGIKLSKAAIYQILEFAIQHNGEDVTIDFQIFFKE